MFFSKRWNPKGLHVYITGGSAGLGLSLAKLVVQKGAHVSIVARNRQRLDEALAQLETVRQNPGQILKAYSFSLSNAKDSAAALQAACVPHGQAPDAVFACAGSSKPMFFVEMEEEDMSEGMVNGYWVQAWTAFVSCRKDDGAPAEAGQNRLRIFHTRLHVVRRLVFLLPGKACAPRPGLADTLQSELMLYGIVVHIFFPPTMFTAGYDEENKTKLDIAKAIESTDDGMTADQAALALLNGVEKGQAHITGDLITSLFRSSTRGAAPLNSWIVDGVYDLIAFVGMPIWKASVDKKVLAHRQEHDRYLKKNGFFA